MYITAIQTNVPSIGIPVAIVTTVDAMDRTVKPFAENEFALVLIDDDVVMKGDTAEGAFRIIEKRFVFDIRLEVLHLYTPNSTGDLCIS